MSAIASRQLEWLLRPIQPLLDDPRVTDLHINGPDPDGSATTVFIKRGSERDQVKVPLSLGVLENIGILEHDLIDPTRKFLPDAARV